MTADGGKCNCGGPACGKIAKSNGGAKKRGRKSGRKR